MDLDPLLISRIQFAFVVSFHILFPAFTIGLASFIAVLEGLYYKTDDPVYLRLSRFWTKIFAVSFGMGVVSGIVMSFQFGTNWSEFAYSASNVFGPLLAYEVVTAFFLEATFLGILLFGRERVPKGVHLFAAIMVAFGTFLSTFWILAANSWMQTPAGIDYRDGMFYVESWTAAIFNPSFGVRFLHMVTAAFLTTAFFVIAVGGWYLLKGKFRGPARIMFSMTFWLVAVLAPAQIIFGDMHGLNTFQHQPAKVAAMEGHWETQSGAPLLLFGLPDQEAETTHFAFGIPNLASLILTHSLDGEVPGLSDFAIDERPYMPVLFWTFRIMVGIGFVMAGMALLSLILRWRGTLFTAHWFHRLSIATLPLGFLAVLTGWITTEMGRYPWVVYGYMRLEDAVTPSLTGPMALASLLVYIVVYAAVFSAGAYYIARIIQSGPDDDPPIATPSTSGAHPKRPLSAPEESLSPAE